MALLKLSNTLRYHELTYAGDLASCSHPQHRFNPTITYYHEELNTGNRSFLRILISFLKIKQICRIHFQHISPLIHFIPLVSFYTSWNQWKTFWFSVFTGYRKRPVIWNGFITNTKGTRHQANERLLKLYPHQCLIRTKDEDFKTQRF